MEDNFSNSNNENQRQNSDGGWVVPDNQNANGSQVTSNVNNQGSYQNNYNNAGVYDDGGQQDVSAMAVASMILGILSVLTGCVFCLGGVLAILAVIFSGVSFSSPKGGRGMAVAGFVTGIVGVIIAVIYTIYWIAVMA